MISLVQAQNSNHEARSNQFPTRYNRIQSDSRLYFILRKSIHRPQFGLFTIFSSWLGVCGARRPADVTRCSRAIATKARGLMWFAIPMTKMRVARWAAYTTKFGVRVGLRRKWLLAVVFVLLAFTRTATAAGAGTEKNILVLYSFSERSVTIPIDTLESALRANVSFGLNFYVEYLEAQRFADNDYQKSLVETLRGTYSGQKLDLVMTESYPALQFALGHRDELFPGVPIAFYGVDRSRITSQQMWPGTTGVTETVGVRATIDLALHLHPNTKTVAVITNGSEYERYWLTAVHGELLRHQNEVSEIDLVSLPTSLL